MNGMMRQFGIDRVAIFWERGVAALAVSPAVGSLGIQSGMRSPFYIRIAEPKDVPVLRSIDVESWGEEAAATEEMLRSRIASYPCGNFVAVLHGSDEVIGSAWSISRDDTPVTSWAATCGDGMYGKACNVFGTVVYGVNASVRRKYAGLGTAQKLIAHGSGVAWDLGKKKVLFGSRIPEYRTWEHVFSAEDYIRLSVNGDRLYYGEAETGIVRAGPSIEEARSSACRLNPVSWPVTEWEPVDAKALDGELGYFLDIVVRGQKCRIFRLLPDYFADEESRNYGVLIGWVNDAVP